jgi:hypothetical protein
MKPFQAGVNIGGHKYSVPMDGRLWVYVLARFMAQQAESSAAYYSKTTRIPAWRPVYNHTHENGIQHMDRTQNDSSTGYLIE